MKYNPGFAVDSVLSILRRNLAGLARASASFRLGRWLLATCRAGTIGRACSSSWALSKMRLRDVSRQAYSWLLFSSTPRSFPNKPTV